MNGWRPGDSRGGGAGWWRIVEAKGEAAAAVA